MLIECDVLPGLKPFLEQEIVERFGKKARIIKDNDNEAVRLEFSGELADLLGLRVAAAVYDLESFDIRGPNALLKDNNFVRIVTAIKKAEALHEPGAFKSFRFSAAGHTTQVFKDLRKDIALVTGLKYEDDDGEMLLRVRPAVIARDGWEVLVRLSPRPLSARLWRVVDMPGALNATIAAAMVMLTDPKPSDRFINLMSGSGTLLIERGLASPAEKIMGVDNDDKAIGASIKNIRAAGLGQTIKAMKMNVSALHLPDGGFNKLCADLPWGQLIGSSEENKELYPIVLTEAARVAVLGADFIVLTHDMALFERVVRQQEDWILKQEIQVLQGGQHPKIYHLRRAE